MVWSMRFILLCLSIVRMSALDFFPEKFAIGERHTNVTLTCRTDKDNIEWKREDTVLSQSDCEKISGRDLTVIDLEEDLTGNYTCWSGTDLQDYTYLLLDKSKEATASKINCTAETFSCTEKIKCAWTSDEFTTFRLRNTRDNGDWVSQSVAGEFFFLPHSTNSYSEESERLLITGEAVSTCCYMKTDHSFFLRDIVKPAVSSISICNISNQGTDKQIIELVVTPPSTWPQPHSFFPLKHQIEYEIRHDGKLQTKDWEEGTKFQVEGSITKLRVRCRDLLLLSQWSEWTPWKNVSSRKKRVRTKGHKKEGTRKQPGNKKKNRRKNCQKKCKHLNWARL
ncbi:interleukin-12 subunit beta isoform X2 [Labeo rohita]|nr:interleukin-12 subunit beta isoform X2 [Labeo rohita]